MSLPVKRFACLSVCIVITLTGESLILNRSAHIAPTVGLIELIALHRSLIGYIPCSRNRSSSAFHQQQVGYFARFRRHCFGMWWSVDHY